MSICCDQRLQDGRRVDEMAGRGEAVQLVDLDTPVTLSWFGANMRIWASETNIL